MELQFVSIVPKRSRENVLDLLEKSDRERGSVGLKLRARGVSLFTA